MKNCPAKSYSDVCVDNFVVVGGVFLFLFFKFNLVNHKRNTAYNYAVHFKDIKCVS